MDPESDAKRLKGYSFLVVFSNDDTISQGELRMLERIALEDKEVDEDERRVLRKIFSRVSEDIVSAEVWEDINQRGRYPLKNGSGFSIFAFSFNTALS